MNTTNAPTIVPLGGEDELRIECDRYGVVEARIWYRRDGQMRPTPKSLRFKRAETASIVAGILNETTKKRGAK